MHSCDPGPDLWRTQACRTADRQVFTSAGRPGKAICGPCWRILQVRGRGQDAANLQPCWLTVHVPPFVCRGRGLGGSSTCAHLRGGPGKAIRGPRGAYCMRGGGGRKGGIMHCTCSVRTCGGGPGKAICGPRGAYCMGGGGGRKGGGAMPMGIGGGMPCGMPIGSGRLMIARKGSCSE